MDHAICMLSVQAAYMRCNCIPCKLHSCKPNCIIHCNVKWQAEETGCFKVLFMRCRWTLDNGMQSCLHPRLLAGVRGLAAVNDLNTGAIAVSVPESMLITEDTAKQSDLVGIEPINALRSPQQDLTHVNWLMLLSMHCCSSDMCNTKRAQLQCADIDEHCQA